MLRPLYPRLREGIRLIVLDTLWWLHKYDKPYGDTGEYLVTHRMFTITNMPKWGMHWRTYFTLARSNRSNILFFGNFNKLTREDYVTGMEELMTDSEGLYDTMARDLYGLGSVLSEKYRLIRIAYNVFMVGLVLSVSSFILVYLLISGGSGF